MHEMSIAISLLELAEAEAAKHGCTRILRLKIEYGAMSGIMPEALKFCFDALLEGGPHQGAILELIEIPVKLSCPACGTIFSPAGKPLLLENCPVCGAISGHNLEQGRELLLSRLEAVPDSDLAARKSD